MVIFIGIMMCILMGILMRIFIGIWMWIWMGIFMGIRMGILMGFLLGILSGILLGWWEFWWKFWWEFGLEFDGNSDDGFNGMALWQFWLSLVFSNGFKHLIGAMFLVWHYATVNNMTVRKSAVFLYNFPKLIMSSLLKTSICLNK